MPILVQEIKTTNGPSGQPRSLVLVTQNTTQAIPLHYLSAQQVLREYGIRREATIELPALRVLPGEYRRLLRDYPQKG